MSLFRHASLRHLEAAWMYHYCSGPILQVKTPGTGKAHTKKQPTKVYLV
jgi:hypothetical protein